MNMKRVGVMTFHQALNYGAVLQAYGLQRFIEEQFEECQVEIIDYRCEKLTADYRPIKLSLNPHRWKRCLASIRNYQITKKMQDNFDEFNSKWLALSEKRYNKNNIKDSNTKYDLFITGSDQVWDPRCAGFDENYFLTFVRDQQKKTSYAASMDKMVIPDNMVEAFKNRLINFYSLSCREQAGAQLVEKLTGRLDVTVNIDPTFLLSKGEWEKVAAAPMFENYLLIYPVGKSMEMVQYAKRIAKDRKLKIVYLDADKGWKDPDITFISGVGPEEYLGLIRHADCIVTNAFHGTAFSIIYHKDFYVYCGSNGKGNERVQNLFKSFEIQNRILSSKNQLVTKTDWDSVDRHIAAERERALKYLKSVIER
ncbi:polysaccharide pyruvyl transferase family protein [Mediterraneibacter glycyrrhizinilyticus]|uniref:polysaccharide pyruvyl transferase family protein n=1 Tax=Mediterraneibacter glycyrrhizinilyticus TaxID=342942 RepID=UPI0025A38A73|nr:polysaccharide pyruvyl transferase family protein [Mediterraneibacter glycyrrhizinilyticus]MDM8125532.1 polysaccharide pyruvyl transferase family protein [Mediterraneibacter glycyrrhizinilyticus]